MTRAHRMAAALAILLPVVGWAGDFRIGFTMYASTLWFRLEITGHDRAGGAIAIGPSELAPRVGPTAFPLLAGSDHFRRTYDGTPLRHHLSDLGRVACTTRELASVDVTLQERRGSNGTVESWTEHVTCSR